MTPNAYDMRAFYTSRIGRVVRRVLRDRIVSLWGAHKTERICGLGYASPYLRPFMDDAERVFAMMPSSMGAHPWPHFASRERNLVALYAEDQIPLETASVDKVLLMHGLEFSRQPSALLEEIWRIMKSSGKLLVVAPNRTGLWARAEWSPMGQGAPYSAGQLCAFLREHRFIHENTHEALFIPPLRWTPVLKAAHFLEENCARYFPFAPGMHMVEASKQIYARVSPGTGSKVPVGGKILLPKPVAQGFKIRTLC